MGHQVSSLPTRGGSFRDGKGSVPDDAPAPTQGRQHHWGSPSRLACPGVATYRVNIDDAGSHGARRSASTPAPSPNALDAFEDRSFWNLADAGITVRDRHGHLIAGLIFRRRWPAPDTHHRTGHAL